MATVGSLSNDNTSIVFSVSRNQVNTFDDLKWDSSVQYATHNRHLQDQLLEFTGTDADKISFSMFFSMFLGVDPIKEVEKLLIAGRNGEVLRLIIGTKAYGKHRWVITKLSKDLQRFDNKGNLLIAKVSVSLTAYSER